MRVAFSMLVKPVNLVRENGDLYSTEPNRFDSSELLDIFAFFFTETRHKTSLFLDLRQKPRKTGVMLIIVKGHELLYHIWLVL